MTMRLGLPSVSGPATRYPFALRSPTLNSIIVPSFAIGFSPYAKGKAGQCPPFQQHLNALRAPLHAGVGVETREQEADAEPGEYDQRESEQCKVSTLSPSPSVSDSRMQEAGICHPGNKRSNFLGIPSPISPPRFIGPHGS